MSTPSRFTLPVPSLAVATLVTFLCLLSSPSSQAESQSEEQSGGPLRAYLEKRIKAEIGKKTGTSSGLYTTGETYQGHKTNESFGGRDFVVYTPSHLPPRGQRPLIVVLHGGMGNAVQIQSYIGLDPLADKHGFIVAYLNGTQVMGIGSANMRGWNAGECCGLPQKKKTDDVGYITSAISYIIDKYGIDKNRVFGTGHSNGAMMTQRLMCETDLYQSTVPISGPLEIDTQSCPYANGKSILALHGADDKNAPVNGGYGSEAINKRTNYRSQAYSKKIFEASGAKYQLILLEGAEHNPESINAALIKTNNVTLPEAIVKFFGLGEKN